MTHFQDRVVKEFLMIGKLKNQLIAWKSLLRTTDKEGKRNKEEKQRITITLKQMKRKERI